MSKSMHFRSSQILPIVLGAIAAVAAALGAAGINALLLVNGKIGEGTSNLLLYGAEGIGILVGNMVLQRKTNSGNIITTALAATIYLFLTVGAGILFVEGKTVMNWGNIAAIGVGALLSYVFRMKNGGKKSFVKMRSC